MTDAEFENNKYEPKCSLNSLRLKLKNFPEKTESQAELVRYIMDGTHVCGAIGDPGTGKTSISLYAAFKRLFCPNNNIRKVLILRSPISTASIGHLPGTIEEKEQPFNIYRDMINNLFHGEKPFYNLVKNGFLEFRTVTHEQGKTYNETFALLDEIGNCTFEQVDLIITRIGQDSQLVCAGDAVQSYLGSASKSGIHNFLEMGVIAENEEPELDIGLSNDHLSAQHWLKIVYFDGSKKVVRNPFLVKYLDARKKLFLEKEANKNQQPKSINKFLLNVDIGQKS
ncbi:PhoH family protein [Vibrio breoganii]